MLKLYNTRTKQKEPFLVSTAGSTQAGAKSTTPAAEDRAGQSRSSTDPVTIYVCGITPYDTTHLGHAFTYVVNDMLIRYLEYMQYPVRYVQNVTDIDDDILKKAKETGDSWQRLVNRWTTHFVEDLQTLNVRPPDYFPRATSVIPQIIDIVQALIDADVAYAAGGNVYYAFRRWQKFGQLSDIPQDEMLAVANERGNRPDDAHKKDPLDFVLWQAQAPGEPAWESPWGPGRPGWHIECSTMATHLLGDTIDLHSGGSDLLFPHHECEIAQVEPVTGKTPFVRFWLHVAMVRYQGEKMSKSLGNLIMARDLLQWASSDALRLYLAQHHYRTPWSYAEDELAAAATIAETLTQAATAPGGDGRRLDLGTASYAFSEAMDDDLDTPNAVAVLTELATHIQSAAEKGWQVKEAQKELRTMARVFGLRLDASNPEERVQRGWQAHLADFTPIDE